MTVARNFCLKNDLDLKGVAYLQKIIEKRMAEVMEEKRQLAQKIPANLTPGQPRTTPTLNEMVQKKSQEMFESVSSPIVHNQSYSILNKDYTHEGSVHGQRGQGFDNGGLGNGLDVNDDFDDDNDDEVLTEYLEGDGTGEQRKKKKKAKSKNELNDGYKIHMKGIKLHEKEMYEYI